MNSYPQILLFSVLTSVSAAAQGTEGTTRICLAPASAKAVAGNTDATIAAVRESFISFLTGPTLSVAPLKARLESQVREEARLAGCPYLLLTSVEHKRKQGSSMFSRALGGAVQQGAWQAGSAAGSAAASIAASAAAGAASAAVGNWAHSVRTKDELAVAYRLDAADGAVLVKKKSKRKAGSDGEDLLSPQVEEAAGIIAEAVTKRSH